ncbi:flavodoxin domain-containing protein [Faecalibaculum rodentium]|uniref:flavodoxin domain-containing protein n=3 Tax=Faecalibaculum rodentium TaxID=1702221 RepID=UPI0026F3BA44|nr:flavodoxin domain-containing protein [Faecalibaculum rodentium]
MNLPLNMICPSHGIIWDQDPGAIVRQYLEWADAYQENQITIVYDTMWNSTRQMAQAIARGIESADPDVKLKLMNAAKDDKNDILTEIFSSKAVLVGSPTINYGISHAIAGLLEMIRGLRFKKKKAAAFGSYGWSGEGPKQIHDHLQKSGFEMVSDPLGILWNPDRDTVADCEAFGRQFAMAAAGSTAETTGRQLSGN